MQEERYNYYNNLKVKDLKKILNQRELSTTGVKSTLAERLADDDCSKTQKDTSTVAGSESSSSSTSSTESTTAVTTMADEQRTLELKIKLAEIEARKSEADAEGKKAEADAVVKKAEA